MRIKALIDFFIHPDYFQDSTSLRKARLFVRANLLTSMFSISYVWLSVFFEFDKGVYLMIFNGVGFLFLPLLAKTKISLTWLGNLYVSIGAIAVITLTYFSGGLWSAIYPWIISIPLLALLVVNKLSGGVWGAIAYVAMMWFGILAIQGVQLPVEYNPEMKTLWFVSVVPGLLLIILFIAFVFEYTQSNTLKNLEESNKVLKSQKEIIEEQSTALKSIVEEKDYIIRIIAHDLKSPLNNIEALTQLLKSDPENIAKYKEMVNASTEKAKHLLSRVMEMDFSDPNEIKLKLQNLNIEDVLKNVVDYESNYATEKGIKLVLINSAPNLKVKADETHLISVFENLISNAIKFSETRTEVTVLIESSTKSAIIKVIDQGLGIKPEEEERLFKKFSKLSTRPTENEPSTGLGLFLVKRHVELIGGKVWYETNARNGSTFIVELPLIN